MSNAEYITLCAQYQELKRMKEEITAEMDGIADQIKAAMGTAETVTAGQYKIRHTTVNGSRLDTAGLKKQLPEIAAEMDGIADQIKAAMGTAETVTAGQYKIRHTTVNGSRLDTAGLKKQLPEIAARFTVATVQKRFSIN